MILTLHKRKRYLFSILLLLNSVAHATEYTDTAIKTHTTTAQPKWEFGLGVGGLITPDYRGSKEYQHIVLPIPYLKYRGKFLKIDRGIRGDIYESKKIEFNISLGASISRKVDDNPLRTGMPELNPNFEMGPSININLSGPDHETGWQLRLPARAVFEFDINNTEINHIGWLLHPNFLYRSKTTKNTWGLNYQIGAYFADSEYHDYYYSVAPQYATALRPEFKATEGYSGFSTQLSLRKKTDNMWYGFYVRYDNLNGTNFTNSPLIETKNYLVIGFGISWIFGQSKETVYSRK